MGKRVILTLLDGSFAQGFPVILRIQDDNAPAGAEFQIPGQLPSALSISEFFRKWQEDFRTRVANVPIGQSGSRSRATPRRKIQSFSDSSAKQLKDELNQWLDSDLTQWRRIRDSLQQHLNPSDEIQLVLQTHDTQLRQLPWQAWELFNTHYPKAEIVLSTTSYQSSRRTPAVSKKVRILAVLGNSKNINIQFDQQVLGRLQAQGAEIEFLDRPTKKHLIEKLWDEQGWHIFFFAGHSYSEEGEIGWFEINQNESLEIDELKNTLGIAIERGLQLAIFNSCDGLGLANQLTALQLPHSIVMREPVPDRVAQEFLEYFLTAFAGGHSFYESVRLTRRKLEDTWNKIYPGISWLPVICQSSAAVSPNWRQLQQEVSSSSDNLKDENHVYDTANSISKNRPKKARLNSKLWLGSSVLITLMLATVLAGVWQLLGARDYAQLESYLAEGNWKEANHKTLEIILKVTGKDAKTVLSTSSKQANFLDTQEINNFPCQALVKLDKLWLQYSQGHFGFSVQKSIFQESMNQLGNYDPITYNHFGKLIGWKNQQQQDWLKYEKLTFTKDAPRGHLPAVPLLWANLWNGEFFSKIKACGM